MVCTCINAVMYVTFRSLLLSEQEDQAPMKMSGPGDPVSQSASAQFPQSSASRLASRLLAEMVQPRRLLQPKLDHYPDIFRVPQRQQEAV